MKILNIFKIRFFVLAIFNWLLCTSIASADSFVVKHTVFYTDVGKGTPLILIHPYITDQSFFKPQQDELQKYFRVISIDLWGFGRSSSVHGQGISMHEYANEVNQLFEHLHIKQAIVGGESMGGYIALAFYKYYPEKIAGLILSDTKSNADDDITKKKLEIDANEIMTNGSTHFIEDLLPKLLSANAPTTLRNDLKHIMQSQPAAGISSALIGMAQYEDTSSLLANMTIPVLIISGDHDEIMSPDHSETMHQLARNSTLVMIKNSGHLPSYEQAKQWNQSVIEKFYLKSNN